jgi:glycosyltransferase involved in cell wall biosynthesis
VVSLPAEPYGLVISEASEAGCAIIGTSVGGIPEALSQGEAGILVPHRSPKAIAEALKQLLSNPAKLLTYQTAARKNLASLTVERMNTDYEAIYLEH